MRWRNSLNGIGQRLEMYKRLRGYKRRNYLLGPPVGPLPPPCSPRAHLVIYLRVFTEIGAFS